MQSLIHSGGTWCRIGRSSVPGNTHLPHPPCASWTSSLCRCTPRSYHTCNKRNSGKLSHRWPKHTEDPCKLYIVTAIPIRMPAHLPDSSVSRVLTREIQGAQVWVLVWSSLFFPLLFACKKFSRVQESLVVVYISHRKSVLRVFDFTNNLHLNHEN